MTTVWHPFKLSAMHQRHLALGATMVGEAGWQRPAHYTTCQRELEDLRRGVGVCDVSPAGKLYVEGEEIDSLLQAMLPGSHVPSVGQVARHRLLAADGSVVDEVSLCRLAGDQLIVLTSPERQQGVAEALEMPQEGCVHLVDMTSALAGLLVVGPRSAGTLSKLTELDLSLQPLQEPSCAQASLALVHATLVPTYLGGLPSFQVYVTRDMAQYIWDAIMEAGHEWGIVPFGLEALQRLGEEA